MSILSLIIGVTLMTAAVLLFGWFSTRRVGRQVLSVPERGIDAVSAIVSAGVTIWFILSPAGEWLLKDWILAGNPDSDPMYGTVLAGFLTVVAGCVYYLIVDSIACGLQEQHKERLKKEAFRAQQLSRLADIKWTSPLYTRSGLWDDRSPNYETVNFLAERKLGKFHE